MNEEKAQEIAIRILDEFEELLEEYNIMIPSVDRTGRPEEARLYGKEYWQLEDAVVDILTPQADLRLDGEQPDEASHPVRQLAIRICDEFEELLAQHDIKIPLSDRTGDPEEVCLYGSVYYALEDAIVGILVEELGAKDRAPHSVTDGIDHAARCACEAMQRRMAKTPDGLVANRLANPERPEQWPAPDMRPCHRSQGR